MEGDFIKDMKDHSNKLLHLCKWLWDRSAVFWSAFLFSILFNIFAALLFFRWPWSTNPRIAENGSFVKWMLQNADTFLLWGIILFLLMCIIGLAAQLEGGPSSSKSRGRYLRRMIRETAWIKLTDNPDLVPENVPLDKVFIPLKLLPNRPSTDYPPTDEQLKHIRDTQESEEIDESNQQVLQQVLIEAEKDRHLFKKNPPISIADLWERLTPKIPAAVIQGYPGMGKSTLMARLTLHMARRCLKQLDPMMDKSLDPPCIPILLHLREYAHEISKGLSLSSYLDSELQQRNIPGLTALLQKSLQNGDCLIMFDGLDEVSDHMRKQVQEAIITFINENSDSSKANFNRFLITSRVAGYQAPFHNYWHYTIKELTLDQIENFLPRWYHASVLQDWNSSGKGDWEEGILLKAEQMTKKLKKAIKGHQGVRLLAENPLLLTVLVIMQQKGIELLKQRVELYTIITRTFLENRNIGKGLEHIPEMQAIERLGPIAYLMQETGSDYVRQKTVMEILSHVIAEQGGDATQVTHEAEAFLRRIRERGGLFVQRTDGYFGFLHPAFREYFVARHVLNQIKHDPDHAIAELVGRTLRRGDSWNESLLLAVAYESGRDEAVARQIIYTLLAASPENDFEAYTRNLLLATECIIEARPLALGTVLEKQIALQLLHIYEKVQQQRTAVSVHVESVVCRWLLSLPDGFSKTHPPVILAILCDALRDMQQVSRQQLVLTLLVMIAGRFTGCPAIVFDILIPPLLSLAGLRSVGEYSPLDHEVYNMKLAALAVFVLSFIGKNGPGGTLLSTIRHYIEDHPESLRLLARYSLESGMFLLPTVAPEAEENYQRYIAALSKWVELRDRRRTNRVTLREVERCINIYRDLLNSAEEIAFPAMAHLVALVRIEEARSNQTWQDAWQTYLTEQLSSSTYIRYQEIVLLWSILFPKPKDMRKLALLIEGHITGDNIAARSSALHFLAMISYYLRELRTQRALRTLRAQQVTQTLLDERDALIIGEQLDQLDVLVLLSLQTMRDLRDLRTHLTQDILQERQGQRNQLTLKDLKALPNQLSLQAQLDRLDFLDGSGLHWIAKILLTHETAEKALQRITERISVTPTETIDLLLILLGRLLQIQEEEDETSQSIEKELHELAQMVGHDLSSCNEDEVEIRLEIIRSLPTRSVNDIKFIVLLATEATDERIRGACAHALRYAAPKTVEAQQIPEGTLQSYITVMGKTAQEYLSRRLHHLEAM